MFRIYLKGMEITSKIMDWKLYEKDGIFIVSVQYVSGKAYHRPLAEWTIMPSNRRRDVILQKKGNIYIQEIEECLEIGGKYALIKYFENDKVYIMNMKDVKITNSTKLKISPIYTYFLDVARQRANIASGEAQNIAENIIRQFDRIVPYDGTALCAYLYHHAKKRRPREYLIYPFGINETQMDAVQRAFQSQISIIEGPPGTGKTQTILNIIANILIHKETCAIVSNNNPAVENVYEKLGKVNLDFLIAKLGNTNNKTEFFQNIHYAKPDKSNRSVTLEEISNKLEKIKSCLKAKNDHARIIAEIQELNIEKDYLNAWYEEHPYIVKDYIQKYKLTSIKTIDLQVYLRSLSKNYLSFKEKFNLMVHYKIFKNKFLNDLHERQNFIFSLQYTYYEKLLKEKNKQKQYLSDLLSKADFELELKELTNDSLVYLYDYIDRNMPDAIGDITLTSYIQQFFDFMNHFPIVGSSTHSLLNSIAKGYLFDYVILDEASQQDIIPGILCLACAKNIIIVGDRKQLPHIPTLTSTDCPEEKYDCEKYSLLDSISEVFKGSIPITLLKEHYRCHPKIIQYCNKQFYNNELIPMTADKG